MSTYYPIQSFTLTSDVSTVVFSNLPQTYQDLVMVIEGTISLTVNSFRFQFNEDTGNNYSYTWLAANSSSASSNRASNASGINSFHIAASSSTTVNQTTTLHLQNYTNTTTNKVCLLRGNANSETAVTTGMWLNTSRITSITVRSTNGDLRSGCNLTLYGIAAGTPKAMGGEVTVSGGFAYHTFKQSGLFIPSENISAEVLVIAGGGAAAQRGTNRSAGGGAGGVVYNSTTLNAINYSVIVGAGATAGTNGNNSSISTFNAIGGGMGGIAAGGAGSNGGSGGGASNNGTGTGGGGQRFGGNPTSGQGFKGGDTQNQTVIVGGWASGAGGGGAGGAGGDATGNGGQFTNNLGGAGGIGTASYNTWALATNTGELVSGLRYYAGGGGGGGITSGGTENFASGGAGGGAAATSGNSFGLANTGGGGGAGVLDSQGGSGVVIVRYAI